MGGMSVILSLCAKTGIEMATSPGLKQVQTTILLYVCSGVEALNTWLHIWQCTEHIANYPTLCS